MAVVGAGISGLTAAYLLSRTHDVVLFEADERLGGHAHTHDVVDTDGQQLAVDSAFIVHNNLWSDGSPIAGTGRFGMPSSTACINGSSISTLSTGDGLSYGSEAAIISATPAARSK